MKTEEGVVALPVTNSLGFYEIRMESIGGFGANLAGKILGAEGHYTRIETPLGIFKALVPKGKSGSPDTSRRAALFFRPEACRINGNNGNCIEGRVDRWEYLGDSITITLNASGVPITIKQNKSVHLTHGQEMRICVGADDCFLLLDL